MLRTVIAALLGLAGWTASAFAQPIPPGDSQQNVNFGRQVLRVFTYRPNCQNPQLLVVFHGLNRNAENYRKSAQPLGDQLCMIVIAPEFDKERFSSSAYQRGGIVQKRRVMPYNDWTVQYVPAIIRWARTVEQRLLDAYLIGHSGGGQFLSRVAAFMPNDARRIVIANPGTHVFPNMAEAPFGFGGVYPPGQEEGHIRRYLAAPVTIFLGEEDTGDENRNDSDDATAQGGTRLERGRNAFAAGQALARQRGWAFNWRIVELAGVGHSGRKMFSSREALDALRP
ncbi:alpha/beta hydrolase family protein [Variibacter gotjawalensis]|uniref:Alpha/beta hydrolase family protein n=1 Tax=Variibacter gotjawalensis TaxID=1333996 RepID=A0A0S3PSW5_9BRAD|nr:hypothetical protein [Variibacter gotjawalensis]NIK49308.1 pimeloyl-ACP methyl ester carboxylesterase [Variibacter gotjawalensis]RZS51158.1 hypothetical protein EV661_3633 [Variibacter gotjawalensis]BAT58994.1 alpha/beta hydrolase family protein [Variibacter gotjawalensis]